MIRDIIKIIKEDKDKDKDKDIQYFLIYLKSYLKIKLIKIPYSNSSTTIPEELLIISDFLTYSLSCNTLNRIFIKMLNKNSYKDIL